MASNSTQHQVTRRYPTQLYLVLLLAILIIPTANAADVWFNISQFNTSNTQARLMTNAYSQAFDRNTGTYWQGTSCTVAGCTNRTWVLLTLNNKSAYNIKRLDILWFDAAYDSDQVGIWGSNDSFINYSNYNFSTYNNWSFIGNWTMSGANGSYPLNNTAQYVHYLVNMTPANNPGNPAIKEFYIYGDDAPSSTTVTVENVTVFTGVSLNGSLSSNIGRGITITTNTAFNITGIIKQPNVISSSINLSCSVLNTSGNTLITGNFSGDSCRFSPYQLNAGTKYYLKVYSSDASSFTQYRSVVGDARTYTIFNMSSGCESNCDNGASDETNYLGNVIGLWYQSISSKIVFVNQTPSDLTILDLMTTNLTIVYSYSDAGNLTNNSIGYYTNSTESCLQSTNGSCILDSGTTRYKTNISSLSGGGKNNITYSFSENDVYPNRKNIPDSQYSTIIAYNLTNGNQYIADTILNITNSSYNIYEVMANSSGDIRVYYFNSSYDFSTNPSTSANVHEFCIIPGGATYNHSHGVVSHHICPYYINNTGFLDTVKVNAGGFLIRGNNNVVQVWMAPTTVRSDATKYTTNNGVAWSNYPGVVASHIHFASNADNFCYYANGAYTNGDMSSNITCDNIDVTRLPPTIPNIITPAENSTYTRIINISYEASTPVSPTANISYYNITVHYTNGTLLGVVRGNNGLNTSYSWNSYAMNLSTDITYLLRVTAKDTVNATSFDDHEFNVTTNGLLNMSTRSLFGNTSINNATTWTVINLNTSAEVNYSGTGSIAFDIIKGNSYTVTALPANFSYANATVISTSNYSLQFTYHYTSNTFFFLFYNESSNTALTGQDINLEVISSNFSGNYTVTNATFNLTFLTPDRYTFRYWLKNQSTVQRDYYTTLTPNSAQNITLFIVDEGISQFYIPTLSDSNLNKVSNATVQLLRYYVDTNEYKVVEMATTNTQGEAVLRVVPNVIYYKFYFISGTHILTTTPTKLTSQTGSYTINLRGSILTSYLNYDSIYKNLSYNDATDTFVLSWSDGTNIVTQGCLVVRESEDGVTNILYDACSTGAIGSIPYTITYDGNKTYEANAWLETNTEYSDYHVGTITIAPNSPIVIFGMAGLVIALLVVTAFALIGGESGTRGTVIAGSLAMLILGVYGIIAYTPQVFIGILIIGGIIVYKIRG